MKLRYSPTSPYVRKIMVLAHEAGLVDQIETIPTSVVPTVDNRDLAEFNPLAKVPTLILAGGEALYDSPVIAEYLDSLGSISCFPPAGPARWAALRQQAIADGLLDAAILTRYEVTLRPEALRWPDWIEGQMRKVRQAIAALDAEQASLSAAVTIGSIAAAVSLGYIDFRYPEVNWRQQHPGLTAFYADFAERPSMRATRPPVA